MSNERKTLDFGDLDEFEPRAPAAAPNRAEQKAIDKTSSFPSRERSDDDQINIKTSAAILDRFRRMAKAERYKHGEFLEVLMNAYEEGRGGR